MTLKKIFKEIYECVIQSLFPNRCICCEEIIDENEFLCDYCYETISRTEMDECCNVCGLPTGKCDCRFTIFHFKGCTAPFYNNDISRRAFYKFKLSHRDYYYEYFAREMAKCINKQFPNIRFSGITYVPLRTSVKLKRGFNQSKLLAEKISEICKIPLIEDVLVCLKKGKGQHNLSGKERFMNVRGIYGYERKLNCVNILLIDDIKTTGATLDECARQLMFAGVHNVYCAAALISPPRDSEKSKKGKEKNGN